MIGGVDGVDGVDGFRGSKHFLLLKCLFVQDFKMFTRYVTKNYYWPTFFFLRSIKRTMAYNQEYLGLLIHETFIVFHECL